MKPSRTRSVKLRHLFALLGVFALLATACGGSAANSADDPDTVTDDTVEESSDDTTDDATEESDSTEDDGADETAEASGDRTEVRWFVGLGSGSQDEQIEAQETVVEAFNQSQSEITLVVEFIENGVAADTLATQIAAGNAPDIIGPVGLEGSNAFAGQYADLDPLIESSGFDMTPYESSADVYRNADGELEGIPFAVFPSAIFYNTELFEEAGLPFPPAEYGDGGVSVYGEGTEWEGTWDWDKLEEIAAVLTVDANGADAASGDFDPESIEQFGFAHQWTSNPTSLGTSFGAGSILQDDGSAAVPAAWIDSWRWYQNLVHNVHAAPNNAQTSSDLLGGNVFSSGRVAMASTHLWYTCCLADGDGNAQEFWDLAALPSRDGEVVSKFHGDTFRIHRDSENPEAAFDVLAYFFEDGALPLLTTYGGLPARDDIRDEYFAGLDDQFGQGVNWDVIVAGLDFPDVPNHQANLPNFLESDAAIKALEVPLLEDPDLDIDTAVADLEAQLESIWAS